MRQSLKIEDLVEILVNALYWAAEKEDIEDHKKYFVESFDKALKFHHDRRKQSTESAQGLIDYLQKNL